jgi:glutathione S-transferase
MSGKGHIDYSAFPNVSRWMDALAERPAFKQASA